MKEKDFTQFSKPEKMDASRNKIIKHTYVAGKENILVYQKVKF